MKKLFALWLIALFSSSQLAFAQEATATSADIPANVAAPANAANADSAFAPIVAPPMATSSDAGTNAPTEDTSPSQTVPPTDTVRSAATSTPLQDTTNTQDTVEGSTLQGASNPEDLATTTVAIDATATSTDATSTPIELQATSTPETIAVESSTTLDVVAADVQPSDAAEPQQQDLPADMPPAPLAQEAAIPVADLAPKPEYTFAMTGKRIAAKRIIRDAAGKTQAEDIAQTITPAIDNATGIMQVSGSCSNTYYVILLFKNQDDYARDPKSYILDKAYPCASGNFSYQIADLPDSLEDGTYYLLVGEEGDKGPWAPITQLTEITINKNH
jgi:hypothetical protein